MISSKDMVSSKHEVPRRDPGLPLGCPRGPSGVPLGSLWSLWGRFRSFGATLGLPWTVLGGPFGYLRGLFGRFGASLEAWVWPKCLKNRKHVFCCVFAHVSKSTCFCMFPESAKAPRNETHVFVCFCVGANCTAVMLNVLNCTCFCVFLEARFSENTCFCVFLCLSSLYVKCGQMC